MTEITMRLPIELANAIYSFVGKSPTAKIIRQHLEKKNSTCVCDLCKEETEQKYYMSYAGQCDMCYISENPHLDTGLGRDCDTCLHELRMYNWCRIVGPNGGEYCMSCYYQQMQSESDESEEEIQVFE